MCLLALAGALAACDNTGARHAPRCRELVRGAATAADSTAALSTPMSGFADGYRWTCYEILHPSQAGAK